MNQYIYIPQQHVKDPGHSRCRWLHVTAEHTCRSSLRVWLCMKWRDKVHGCMGYTERAQTAAVSRGTSHVTTKQHCTYAASVDI